MIEKKKTRQTWGIYCFSRPFPHTFSTDIHHPVYQLYSLFEMQICAASFLSQLSGLALEFLKNLHPFSHDEHSSYDDDHNHQV